MVTKKSVKCTISSLWTRYKHIVLVSLQNKNSNTDHNSNEMLLSICTESWKNWQFLWWLLICQISTQSIIHLMLGLLRYRAGSSFAPWCTTWKRSKMYYAHTQPASQGWFSALLEIGLFKCACLKSWSITSRQITNINSTGWPSYVYRSKHCSSIPQYTTTLISRAKVAIEIGR